MNLCKILKQKRDAEQRLRQSDTAKNVIIIDSDGTQQAVDPAKPTWDDIQGKPNTYPPALHSHEEYLTSEDLPTVPEKLTDFADTPASYEGQAGKALVVNDTEDGLVFGASGGGATTGAFDFGSIAEASSYTWDWGSLT